MRRIAPFVILLFLFAVPLLAQENTTNETVTNETMVNETQESPPEPALISDNETPQPAPQQNITTTPPVQNQTPVEVPKIINFTVSNLIPKEFTLSESGDIQFNLQIKNTGNVNLENVAPLISGKGFATYDVVPIDELKPGEKSYVLVMGNVRQAGDIKLTVRLMDKTSTFTITVIDPNAGKIDPSIQKRMEEEAAKAAKQAALAILSNELSDLKSKYDDLEADLAEKTKSDYDVAAVQLNDLKQFLRDAEASRVSEDVVKMNASLTLAKEEVADQATKLEAAQVIERSLWDMFKDNILLFSTLAGAVITLVTLFEIVNKKKDSLYQKIKEVQVNEDTKIVVKQKKSSKNTKIEVQKKKKASK